MRAAPEQPRCLRIVGLDLDRSRSQIGEVKARIVNPRDRLVLGKPARERRDLRKVERPAEVFENRSKLVALFQHGARSHSPLGIDVARQADDQPRFLQSFADNGDLVRVFFCIIAAKRAGQRKIRLVHPPTGEHSHTACKCHRFGADLHQDFCRSPIIAIAENDDGGGGNSLRFGRCGLGHAEGDGGMGRQCQGVFLPILSELLTAVTRGRIR